MPQYRSTSEHLPPILSAHLRRRGLGLHDAAYHGNRDEVEALLSTGRSTGDPNQRGPAGWTPLMLAVEGDHEEVAKVLLNSGAAVSMAMDEGFTALHFCAKRGNVSITKLLVKAGADVVALTSAPGSTPLHVAAEAGRSEVMALLIEAGASLNYRTPGEGETPLFTSCDNGQVEAVRVLVRAGADPLLTRTDELGQTFLPLEAAAFRGHSGVVRELAKRPGIGACGGTSRGVDALRFAAQNSHVGTMAILMDAGVVDTGRALVDAAGYCGEAAVKLLLQRRQRQRQQQLSVDTTRGGDAYVNAKDDSGRPAIISGILLCRSGSPRVVRRLIDAGADTTSAVRLTMPGTGPFFRGTPLDFLKVYVGQKKEGDVTEETLNMLEAIRRLLLRVEAVHAVSWLWHTSGDVPVISHAAQDKARTKTVASSAAAAVAATPLRRMLPILRRRANRRGVLLASLFR